MSMAKIKDTVTDDDEFLINCSCGQDYYADPCTEENTIRIKNDLGYTILVGKCPYCGKRSDHLRSKNEHS